MQEPDPESGLPIGTPPAQPPEPAAGQAGAGGTPSQGPAHGITSPDSGGPRVPASQQCAASAHRAAAGQPSGTAAARTYPRHRQQRSSGQMPPTPPSFAQYAPASGQMPPQEPQPFQSQNPYATVQPPQPSQYPHAVVHGYPGGMYSPPPQLDWFQAQHAAGQLYVDGWGQQSGALMGA